MLLASARQLHFRLDQHDCSHRNSRSRQNLQDRLSSRSTACQSSRCPPRSPSKTGTIFGLLGPNGAGKSTTMKILTTLARPDSGQARVADIDVLVQPDAVRRVIGYVAQRSGIDPEINWPREPHAARPIAWLARIGSCPPGRRIA